MEIYINEKISASQTLSFLKSQFSDAKTKVHAFQMYKGDELMVRLAPPPYSNTHKRQVYSLSKSFASTAIGIACDMGILKVTDKICDIFKDEIPSNPDEYLSELTVWHLLTMSAGHAGCSMKEISLSDDGVKAFCNKEIVNKPGEKYLYDTGASYMLSAVITKLTGLSMLDFLNINLFRYMDIKDTRWPFAGGDINEGGFGLRISADDIAKFGLLYLNNGIYNGKRLISEKWIKEATTGYLSGSIGRDPDWMSGYGYQIWRNAKGGYRADGAFGQYCIVVPEKNIVIVILTESENVEKELSLCFDYMDCCFEKDTCENSKKELESFISGCYKPYKSDQPVTAEKRLYRLNENINKLTLAETENTGEKFTLRFSDGEKSRIISAGNGNWIENRVQLKGFYPQLYSLCSEIRTENSLFLASYKSESSENTEIELKFTDCPHTVILKVEENKQQLKVKMDSKTNTLPENPFCIEGTTV